jgi:uncharacterized membrane protein
MNPTAGKAQSRALLLWLPSLRPAGLAQARNQRLDDLFSRLMAAVAADIVETSITEDWQSIGRIAAIAVIRTFLNYFLDRDVAEVREQREEAVSNKG